MLQSQTDLLVKNKKEKKKDLVKSLSLSKENPLMGIFIDGELDKVNTEILKKLNSGFDILNLDVVILSDERDDLLFNIKFLEYNIENRNHLLEAADMALAFDFNDVEEMLLNGVVPISYARDELIDYDLKHEIGNSFTYTKNNVWSVFMAVVRALETFKLPYDWKGLIREGLESRLSSN